MKSFMSYISQKFRSHKNTQDDNNSTTNESSKNTNTVSPKQKTPTQQQQIRPNSPGQTPIHRLPPSPSSKNRKPSPSTKTMNKKKSNSKETITTKIRKSPVKSNNNNNRNSMQAAAVSEKTERRPPAAVKRSPSAEPVSRKAVSPGPNHARSMSTDSNRATPTKKEEKSKGGSMARFRHLSERAAIRVRTFVSRPIKEAAMNRFVDRVQQRKALRAADQTSHKSSGSSNRCDDVFPGQKQKEDKGFLDEKTAEDIAEGTDGWTSSDGSTSVLENYVPRPGLVLIQGNKNNNGKLFIKGDPWWMQNRRPTNEDKSDSATEDDLPMNAEVVLEVQEGTKKLINMPNLPVILDPWQELSDLKKRDKYFFNREVMFGNTIRSMINLTDESTKLVKAKTDYHKPIKIMPEPEFVKVYKRSNPNEFEEVRKCLISPLLAKSTRRSNNSKEKSK